MLKHILFSLFLSGTILLTACSENSTTAPTSSGQDDVVTKTTAMTKGSGSVVSTIKNDDTQHWEVRVDMPGDGGIVKFEYQLNSNELREVKGLSSSFEYEIEPGNGLINYSTAKGIALGAVNGNIIEWKLEKDESDNNWQYRFEIGSSEVRINASTGNIIRVKY
ncbi:MAG: PepSY domain-containing protein [Ignavibacteriaceae bacterium]